jgi:hypothetical protein
MKIPKKEEGKEGRKQKGRVQISDGRLQKNNCKNKGKGKGEIFCNIFNILASVLRVR